MRAGVALVLVLALAPLARAGDAPPSPPPAPKAILTIEQAADAVLAAVKAKDDPGLKALAAKDDPDPWRVADALLARAEAGVALAFANAAPRVDVQSLPAYVASRRGLPDDPVRRSRLDAANDALASNDARAALAVLDPPPPGSQPDVVGIRIAAARGQALDALHRPLDAAASFLLAADAAERIGWLGAATIVLHSGGASAHRGSDYAAARSAWERRLRVCEKRSDAAGAAEALGNIGVVHNSLGDYAKALSVLDRALAMKEAVGDRVGAAQTLGNIGIAYKGLGDYARALSTYERARAAKEALGDRTGAARTLANVGVVHEAQGDYARALSAFERALAALQALGDKGGATATLGNLGNVYGSLGDFARALSMHERALAAKEALGDRAGAAQTLGNIGIAHHRLGDHAKALSAHERALAIQTALGDEAGAAVTLGNIGVVNRALGDHAKALSAYQRALAAMEVLGDRSGAARLLGNLGVVYDALGDHAKALDTLESALASQEALGDKGEALATLGNIARGREALGETEKALEAAGRAMVLRRSLVTGLAFDQGALAREQFVDVTSIGLRASAAAKDVERAQRFLEEGRAGALLEAFSAREALQSSLVPADLRTAEAQARAQETAAVAAYRKSLDSGDVVDIRAKRAAMEGAQQALIEVVERIQREAKRAASVVHPKSATLAEIRQTIGASEALVLYALTGTQALALVVEAKGARIAALPATNEIQAACAGLDLVDTAGDPQSVLSTLRKAVVEPLGLGTDVRRVLVSPEGCLCYVPFALLMPEREVAYVPSGTTYGLLLEEKGLAGQGILALGDPDYGARPDLHALAVLRGGARLVALPGTRAEAKAVGDELLLGADASEAGLLRALGKRERWRAVHFACHGLVDPERPSLSSLALTSAGEDDGFLTALEVFRTKIPADLVVLSACETGKGRIVKGEGIVGLARAFMYAGAPRVICSLWKVDDEATRALMTRFYALWNPKDGSKPMGTAAALRSAQEFVRSQEKWEHPYFWAAWVLWGLPS